MRTYSGNVRTPERISDCIESVGAWSVQCGRKRGFGPDGLYCWQHAKKHSRNVNYPNGDLK